LAYCAEDMAAFHGGISTYFVEVFAFLGFP
jgi:hypothetical protein